MPSYKSVISSVRYHAVTRPAIHHTAKLLKKTFHKLTKKSKVLRNLFHEGHGSPHAGDLTKKVHEKTRTQYAKKHLGVTQDSAKLFEKRSMAASKRRKAAAVEARKIKRPLRTHNRFKTKILGAKVYTNKPKP